MKVKVTRPEAWIKKIPPVVARLYMTLLTITSQLWLQRRVYHVDVALAHWDVCLVDVGAVDRTRHLDPVCMHATQAAGSEERCTGHPSQLSATQHHPHEQGWEGNTSVGQDWPPGSSL